MVIITFANLKGGVGKSTILILLARFLAALGFRILVVDSDLQSSTTLFFSESEELNAGRSIAEAMYSSSVDANIVSTSYPRLDFVPSSFNLTKLRVLAPNTYRKLLRSPSLEAAYDYVLIDSPAGFDNFVVAASAAADTIIVPFQLSTFDIKAASHFILALNDELDSMQSKKIHFIINRSSTRSNESESSMNNQYRLLARNAFPTVFPDTCPNFIEIPESRSIKNAIDVREVISNIDAKKRVFDSIASIASLIAPTNNSTTSF